MDKSQGNNTMKRWFEVEYLDTENRVYTIWVNAIDEDEAEDMAWEDAEESYHGPKEILSIC